MNAAADVPLLDAPTLAARARALVPELRVRAAQCESGRRIPEATLQDLREAGILRATVPKRYGGHEQGWDVLCELIMELASGCGSTGWVYAVVGQHPLIANLFGHRAMEEIWGASADVLMSSSKRIEGGLKKADGGYRASGIATFSSGCQHADWIIVENLPLENGGRDHTALIPRREVEILDTWNVIGLAGTGSHDVKFDVFVPDHRVWWPGKPPSGGAVDSAPFRLPGRIVPFTLASVLVGIADGAVEQFAASVRGRSSRQGVRIADLQSLQMRVGESAVEVDAAKTFIRAKLQELMARLAQGRPAAPVQHGDAMSDPALSAFAMQLALRAVDRVFYAAGASELKLGGGLQRAFRDAVAGSRQFGHNWDAARTRSGRLLLGLER